RGSHRGLIGRERQQFTAGITKELARPADMPLAAITPQVIAANLAGLHSVGNGMAQRATRHRIPPSLTASPVENAMADAPGRRRGSARWPEPERAGPAPQPGARTRSPRRGRTHPPQFRLVPSADDCRVRVLVAE